MRLLLYKERRPGDIKTPVIGRWLLGLVHSSADRLYCEGMHDGDGRSQQTLRQTKTKNLSKIFPLACVSLLIKQR